MVIQPHWPCQNCDNRSVGCHATCEKYKACKDEHDKVMNAYHIYMRGENEYIDFAVRSVQKRKERFEK